MQIAKAIFFIFSVMVMVCGCIPSRKTVYKDKDVTVIYHDTVNLANVHASSEDLEIKVVGRSYDHVCGHGQAFLRLPDTNSIAFFVGGNYVGHQAAPVFLHVLNLKTKKDTEIATPIDSMFDAWIDASKTNVSVVRYDEHKLILSLGSAVPPSVYEFDLDTKRSALVHQP